MTNVENFFIKPLVSFYGRNPFGEGFALKLEPYAKSLSAEILNAVADRICETGGKTFPTFSQCKDAIAKAGMISALKLATDLRPYETQKRDAFDWERRVKAIKLCRCQMGDVADREGWLPALIEFCQDTSRLPDSTETPGVRGRAQRSEDALDQSRGSPFYQSLMTWRRNMIERAHVDVFGERWSSGGRRDLQTHCTSAQRYPPPA